MRSIAACPTHGPSSTSGGDAPPAHRGFPAAIQFRSNPMTSPSRTLPPATAAARIAPLLLALAGLAIAIGGLWLWRHRRQIGAALVATAAATYLAVVWCRLQVEALAADSARRLPAQPVAALAPITATLAAAWGLVDRGTMTRSDRARQALLADIASNLGDDLAFVVSKILKAIDENNAYLKQTPNTITLSTQNSRIDNTEDQLWLKWLRDHGWTVVQ